MLKVVRRDNYQCQICGAHLLDNQLEFDHIIPLARGGRTSAENLGVLCISCNQKKADSVAEILWKEP